MSLSSAASDGLIAALEAALADSPDDRLAHGAFADVLVQRGDPRGRFIQTQLALEDTARTAEQRQKLLARERSLFRKHGRAWLGDLADCLLDPKKNDPLPLDGARRHRFRLARGWLEVLALPDLDTEMARRLVRAPLARLLRCLHLDGVAAHDGEPRYPALGVLREAPFLPLLWSFTLQRGGGPAAVDLVAGMRRLEELFLTAPAVDADRLLRLRSLPHLRVLHLRLADPGALWALADNPSFGRLTHLFLQAEGGRADDFLPPPLAAALASAPHLANLRQLEVEASGERLSVPLGRGVR